MSQEGDLPFTEEAIDRYPFSPEDKGWRTKNDKKERRRALVEKEVIRRGVLRGIGSVIDERVKHLPNSSDSRTKSSDPGDSDVRGRQESQRREDRAKKRRELGREQRDRRRRILGG